MLAFENDYAVFPLHTVLFPGCALPLRIFEPRYLRMVSECSRDDRPFVIALIDSSQGELVREVGEASGCHEVGTLARITDFNQSQKGVLEVVVRAGTRVMIQSAHHESDLLMKAPLDSFRETELLDLPEQYQGFKQIFNSLKQGDPSLVSENVDMLSATELSFFLSHLAPVSNIKKQKLLALDDCEERLAMLKTIFSETRFTFTA